MAVNSMKMTSGKLVPCLGLGTWKSTAGDVEKAVMHAIDVGYRHIDTAHAYGNEAEVGVGINAKIADGTVKREDLFVCTKLWNSQHHPNDVLPSLKQSLNLLKLDYVDLYLIHWPMALKPGAEKFPRDEAGNLIFADISLIDTWKEMEKCVATGLVKSIGVSNFNKAQVQEILDNCKIPPAMQQIEVNPYFVNEELVKFCQSKNICVTAYSPLGSADRPWASPSEPVIMEDPKLKAIADRLGKSVAQVLLRWLIQRNIIVIPKSTNPQRIEQNLKVLDFELTQSDMDLIASFDRGFPLVVPMAVGPDGKRTFRDLKAPNFPFSVYLDKMLASQS